MPIESEKKRLNDFLAEQTAAYEATKRRAREPLSRMNVDIPVGKLGGHQ
jgi:hypothetical protein